MTCTGDGNPTCGQQADALVDADGRHLPNLLARLGLPPDDEVAAACFSAGGSAWKRILMSRQDRQQTRVLHLADGAYTATSLPGGAPEPPEGFVLYGLDCLAGDRLFVATASGAPNKQYPSGIQTLRAIEDEIAARSGVSFEEGGELPGLPPPERLARAGGIIFCYYPQFGHGEQATKLGGPVWQNVIEPWLAGDRSAVPGVIDQGSEGDPSGADALVLLAASVAGAAAGYAAVRLWRGTRSRS